MGNHPPLSSRSTKPPTVRRRPGFRIRCGYQRAPIDTFDLNQRRHAHRPRLFPSFSPYLLLPYLRHGGSAMKGTIELVAGTGLDEHDIDEIQNAVEAALQGTRYEDVFSLTTTRETESDTSMYYLIISVPVGGTTDNYADVEHRLQSSLLCHVEFASQ
jgi:hypothetical protein